MAENKDSTSLKEAPLLLLKGFIMGSADIIPGVSGGTMALILGIYQRLLNAINSVNTQIIRYLFTFQFKQVLVHLHWKFLAAVIGGILLAVLFFTKVVSLQVYMFTDPELIYGLFFGLIMGSIFILFKALDRYKWQHTFFLILGIFLGFWIVTLVPTDTPEAPWFIFLSGSVAIIAMIMPGISGSYILLILRKYNFILSNIGMLGTESTFDAVWVLLPFGLGIITGLALFSRLLSWLLDRFYSPTLLVLIGFLIGSLYVIWPFQERTYATFEQVVSHIPLDSKQVRELQNNPPSADQPEYYKLGNKITEDGIKKVEYIRIKKKLIESEPYLPLVDRSKNRDLTSRMLWEGIAGILIGISMVGVLERIR